ncbi:MAG: methyltransferase domain-containing protein [Candidatus Wallbacteria bacterium]
MNFLKKFLIRNFIKKVNWVNFRNTKPVSPIFGLDRGTPIDRYYIEKFLSNSRGYIKGTVLEISENTYSKKFGNNVIEYDILHYDNSNKDATIIGDLTKIETLPANKIDCFICTQTFNFIYDFKSAVKGSYHLLKKKGVLLATLGGISQISKYDMERWGDYWRFTTKSAQNIFSEIFGSQNVKIDFWGNVLSAVSFLEGISAEELTEKELEYKDDSYQMLITVVAKKV